MTPRGAGLVSNQTETVYTWNWNGFVPEIRWRQKKEKKVFARVEIEFLRPNSLQVQSQSHILVANANGGLISLLEQILVSEVLKTGYFA